MNTQSNTAESVDIGKLIEAQRVGPFLWWLIIASWLVTFFDGFDLSAISFAAPYLAKDMGLTKIMLGNLFSVGLAGSAIGGILFGFLGDRWGRRPVILFAVAAFGVTTLCVGFSHDYHLIFALRFLTGVAVGGALPLIWTLNIEFAPKRLRSTIITVIMFGYTLGGSFAGPATVWLAPDHGWRAVFLAGGVATIVALAILWFILPESVRFLTKNRSNDERIAKIASRIDPSVSKDAVFVIEEEAAPQRQRNPLARLFTGPLRIITPALWLAYICSSAMAFLISNWTPIMMESVDFTRTDAAWIASAGSILASLGGFAIARVIDRIGPLALAALPALGTLVLAALILADLTRVAFLVSYMLIFLLVGGAHHGINSIAGIFYATDVRASGTGWALSISKIGGVIGPIAGGLFLSSALFIKGVFMFELACASGVMLCLIVLGTVYNRSQVGDRAG
ncbi:MULTISPECIES: MFS transporter [unclassified Sphingomonas]|uniref:MFS transporter n=1 Tax=unclassified Sphingomonas TaxID=196159 RepID=UPI0007005301|nr:MULTISPECIES: MFS transporter [unclassified Sphingomonas]KQX19124.1 hypothetical protein ASD17_11185 [Sphingomonas sp. Root1294]KQY65325.1 hypothetical protein ASD39_14380 [Sphingomonas sp. Root50]KRB95380.1 hypothetical protein ASE22_05675 [Sphingomonas sp. Root720]